MQYRWNLFMAGATSFYNYISKLISCKLKKIRTPLKKNILISFHEKEICFRKHKFSWSQLK